MHQIHGSSVYRQYLTDTLQAKQSALETLKKTAKKVGNFWDQKVQEKIKAEELYLERLIERVLWMED